MNVDIAIDDSELMRKLVLWMAKKDKTIEQAATTWGRTVCRAMLEYTFPRENGKMERRVAADIRRVYVSQNQVYNDIKNTDAKYATRFWYLTSTNKWAAAKKIMQQHSPKYGSLSFSKFDGGTAHSRVRNSRGRVGRGQSPIFAVQDRGKKSKLHEYIFKKQKQVGTAKAGWAQAWRDLGGARGIPEWVKRNRGALGSGKNEAGPKMTRIEVWNKVRHALLALGENGEKYKEWIKDAASGRMKEFLTLQLGSWANR